MDRQRRTSWTEARGLIRRPPRDYLIVKPERDPQRPWEFPGGRVGARAAPEDVLRLVCRARLGIELDELVSQPAFDYRFGTHTVRYRYYVCRVRRDEATPQGYAELRWVSVAQLREYVFDAPSHEVVGRLVTAHEDR